MITNRRSFLRGAFTASAAATVPAVALGSSILPQIEDVSASAIGEGMAIFKVNGESVLVDLNDIHMGEGARAVVFDHENGVKVMEVINNDDDAYAIRQRAGRAKAGVPVPGSRTGRYHENVRIIGKVIERGGIQQAAAAPPSDPQARVEAAFAELTEAVKGLGSVYVDHVAYNKVENTTVWLVVAKDKPVTAHLATA